MHHREDQNGGCAGLQRLNPLFTRLFPGQYFTKSKQSGFRFVQGILFVQHCLQLCGKPTQFVGHSFVFDTRQKVAQFVVQRAIGLFVITCWHAFLVTLMNSFMNDPQRRINSLRVTMRR